MLVDVDAQEKCTLAFMSYQTANRAVAGRVSNLLATLGIQAFMAHEHIEVSMQWRDEILRQIGLANLFVPILSQNYYASIWCKQESGIAAFRRITVIPLLLRAQGTVRFVHSLFSFLPIVSQVETRARCPWGQGGDDGADSE